MEKSDLEKIINNVLQDLVDKDVDILEVNINERTISHRFAIYLEAFFNGWNIDCEYNRDHDDRKTLNIDYENHRTDDIEAKTVFPDIIVHQRKTNKNLLVIEMKKSTNTNSHDRDKDIKKLKAFKRELNYQFAIFIDIGVQNNIGQNSFEFIEE